MCSEVHCNTLAEKHVPRTHRVRDRDGIKRIYKISLLQKGKDRFIGVESPALSNAIREYIKTTCYMTGRFNFIHVVRSATPGTFISSLSSLRETAPCDT